MVRLTDLDSQYSRMILNIRGNLQTINFMVKGWKHMRLAQNIPAATKMDPGMAKEQLSGRMVLYLPVIG